MDIRITPVPTEAGLTLLLSGATLPAAGMQVQRGNPQIDAALLERFRRTKINQVEFRQLSDAVTNWLFDNQLRQVLNNALPGNGSRLRLVFVVPDSARAMFSDLPLELLWHDTPDKPLVLREDVQTIAYLLQKAQVPARGPGARNWPFKVLIVRASPSDLDAVPEVSALAQQLRELGAHYGLGMVEVDVISVEPAIGKPATWDQLRQHLRETNDYNVLVYLGHGELVPSATGGDPIGHIFMESEDGGGHLPVSAPQLARLLATYPIGVVVLAGCLTGDDPANAARLHGGEQGVAQALVNSSESGVEIAVAMRTELKTQSALTFLKAFFQSLLDVKPDAKGRLRAGDVESAVRHARNELYLDNPNPPQWAAPVVLRASEREPYIDYLAQPVKFRITDRMKMLLELRATFWATAANYSLAAGMSESLAGHMAALSDIKQRFRAEGLLQGPLLLPRDATIPADQEGQAVFELAGALSVSEMRGRITVAAGVTVRNITVPANVSNAFALMVNAADPSSFELRSRDNAVTPLPEGDVLQVTVRVGAQAAPGIYGLGIEIQKMEKPGLLWPGDAVVIVPRP